MDRSCESLFSSEDLFQYKKRNGLVFSVNRLVKLAFSVFFFYERNQGIEGNPDDIERGLGEGLVFDYRSHGFIACLANPLSSSG